MKTTTDFQLVDITKLIPYVNNARTHSKEQITKLRSSLREFGFVSPMVIDKDYNVLCGHGRLEAAKAEGIYRHRDSVDATVGRAARGIAFDNRFSVLFEEF